MKNINSVQYWNNRFKSGDWENKKGKKQTRHFAQSQMKYIEISKNFKGTLLDFGCGLGDAMPIYKRYFPKSNLIGIDISSEAIKKCKKSYAQYANFICGSFEIVKNVDIIIASNVFEHLSNDKQIAKQLFQRSKEIYIIVPYKEKNYNNPSHEHVNQYDEFSFDNISSNISFKIFKSKGWGEDGLNLYYNVYFKNIARFILGRPLRSKAKQIMFKLKNNQ